MGRSVAFGTMPGAGANDEQFVIGIHLDGQADISNGYEFWQAVWQDPACSIPPQVQLLGVRWEPAPDVPSEVLYYPAPIGGHGQGANVPCFVACCVTILGAGVNGQPVRNRFYLPALALGFEGANPNLIPQANADALCAAIANHLNSADLQGHTVVHWKGTDYDATTVQVDTVWDTQRRRKFQTKGVRLSHGLT